MGGKSEDISVIGGRIIIINFVVNIECIEWRIFDLLADREKSEGKKFQFSSYRETFHHVLLQNISLHSSQTYFAARHGLSIDIKCCILLAE